MAVLSKVIMQLRQERERAYSEVTRLDGAIAVLMKLVSRDGAGRQRGSAARKPRRKLSVAARKRIAAAQKARWARFRRETKKAAGK